MGKVVQVKNIRIGEGIPKICVPITGETMEEIMGEVSALRLVEMDIVEWRVDFYENAKETDKVISTLEKIRDALPEVPIIFTFRTAKEGGEKAISPEQYLELNKAIVKSGLIDIVDIELDNEAELMKDIVEFTHLHGVYVIISNHDFHQTPNKEEIISRLMKAQDLGADIPKIAVMPKAASDVLTLLEATNIMKEQYAKQPVITMSMAGSGVISRLAGEIFGSAVTFGAARKASAPGQVDVKELRNVLKLLHNNLES